MTWHVLYDATDTDVHVVPDADLVDHALDDRCVCAPTPQLVACALGQDAWVQAHHSLDGRETREVAE